MSTEIFFLIGYPILILICWLFPFLRRLFLHHKPELLAFSSAYYFFLADKNPDEGIEIFFKKEWSEINNFLVGLSVILGLFGILLSAFEKSKLKKLNETMALLNEANHKLATIRTEYYKLCSDSIKNIFSSIF
jgi:hypothetical protein